MNNNNKTRSAEETLSCFTDLMTKISDLENQISDLPDFFESLNSNQKNQLFHEFERLCQNLNTLSSWLSLPVSHKTRLGISPNLKVMISQEEGSIILKLLEIPKKG